MKLDSQQLYEALQSVGVKHLYHANTLTTSLSFIQLGGITSRGRVEASGLRQTWQSSDDIDRKYNVWNDIFLDTVDLHNYSYTNWTRQNLYGPILFELRADLLLDKHLDDIWITTDNPSHWNRFDSNRYFKTVSDFMNEITVNRQQKMITIRGIDKIIPFKNDLSCVYIDNPNIKINGIDLFDYCKNRITEAFRRMNISVPIKQHTCHYNCFCHQNYNEMSERELINLFAD